MVVTRRTIWVNPGQYRWYRFFHIKLRSIVDRMKSLLTNRVCHNLNTQNSTGPITNNQLTGTAPSTGSVQPPASTFLCNGQTTATYNTACAYPNPPSATGLFTGVPTTSGANVQFSCNGALSTFPNSACTYPTAAVNGIFQGVTSSGAGGTVSQFSCNGALSALPNTACTYPTAAVNGIFQGVAVSGTGTTGTQYLCNGQLYNYPFGGCTYPTTTGNTGTGTQYLCNGILYNYPNPACTYPTG